MTRLQNPGAGRKGDKVRHSVGVRQAWLRFCERLSTGDVASFDELVFQEPAALIIGTAPGEWVTERERMRFAAEEAAHSSVLEQVPCHGGILRHPSSAIHLEGFSAIPRSVRALHGYWRGLPRKA